MQQRVETALMVIAVACAVAVTTRLFSGGSSEPRPEDVWPEILEIASVVGARHAPLQLALFTDVECPYCGTFANDYYPKLSAKYGQDLALLVVHLPSQRPYAYEAARALECAGEQERFGELFSVVEASAQPLDSETLIALGDSVRIPDPLTFRDCVVDSSPVAAIERGKAAAARLALRGTPSFIINGSDLIRGLPTYEHLDSLLGVRRGK